MCPLKYIKYSVLYSFFLILVSCSTSRSIPRLEKKQKYIITKTIDLRGEDWVLPENVILRCTSNGMIKNGRIVGDNSTIDNLRIKSVHFSGSFNSLKIVLLGNEDSLCAGLKINDSLQIIGNRHIISSTSFGTIRNVNVEFRNVVFDCSESKSPFLYCIGNGQNIFVVEDCKFINIPQIELLVPRNMRDPVIRRCEFSGLLKEGVRSKATIVLNRFYECKGNIVFEENHIHDCYGVGVNGIGYSKKDGVSVSIKKNVIKSMSNGGIVFNGGEVTNVSVEDNIISNIYCFGPQFNGEKGNAENAAINFHGFHNLHILNNTISDCTHSLSLDVDGTSLDAKQIKGDSLYCRGNIMRNVLQSYLFGVRYAEFFENDITIAEQPSASTVISGITLNSCHNVNLFSNVLRMQKPQKTDVYPIVIRQNTNQISGKISIHDNFINSDGNIYLMIYNGFTGNVDADNNKAISTNSCAPLKWVNNSKSKGIRVMDKNEYR